VPARAVLQRLLEDGDVRRFLQINRYQDVLWFNQESFTELLGWLLLGAEIEAHAAVGRPAEEAADLIAARYAVVRRLRQAGAGSGYRVERLLER
jgi:hypothetical protein